MIKIPPRSTRYGSYCSRLWSHIFIDQNGDVYACCHLRPGKLGNIYERHLKEICNSPEILKFRAASLKGKLSCYRWCSLLSSEELAMTPPADISIQYRDLKHLKILFGEACNIQCVMCWQNSRKQEMLNAGKLCDHVLLDPFESITVQGGEPLFIRSAGDFFDYAASRNKKVSFLTNGTMITETWAEKIAKNGDVVQISINAATQENHEYINYGSKWTIVLRNIERLRQARARSGSPLKIIGHMTLIPRNLVEIPLFLETYGDLGFDSPDFGFEWKIPVYLGLHPGFRKRLKADIRRAIANGDISEARLDRLAVLGLAE